MRPDKQVLQSVQSVPDLQTIRQGVVTHLFTVAAFVFMTIPAAAQCGPDNPESCSASTNGFESILSNLFEVVMLALQYGGFIALVLGLVVYMTARRSSRRAQYGSWLLMGGILMLIVNFGFGAIISVFKFIAGG